MRAALAMLGLQSIRFDQQAWQVQLRALPRQPGGECRQIQPEAGHSQRHHRFAQHPVEHFELGCRQLRLQALIEVVCQRGLLDQQLAVLALSTLDIAPDCIRAATAGVLHQCGLARVLLADKLQALFQHLPIRDQREFTRQQILPGLLALQPLEFLIAVKSAGVGLAVFLLKLRLAVLKGGLLGFKALAAVLKMRLPLFQRGVDERTRPQELAA